MSRLSDLISEAVGDALRDGQVDVHEVAKAVEPRLEDDDRDTLIAEALGARIKSMSTKTRKAIETAPAASQGELFFGLPPAVPLDDKIKLTSELTRLDVERVIKVRRAGIADDLKSVERWEAARDATAPLLDEHPDWTFGQALNAAMALVAGRAA